MKQRDPIAWKKIVLGPIGWAGAVLVLLIVVAALLQGRILPNDPSVEPEIAGDTVFPDISGDPSVAEKRVVEAIRQRPSDAENFRRLGNVFVKQGRLRAAEGAYQKAIKLDPKDVGSYLNLGNVYFLMSDQDPRKLDSAIQIYQTASRLAPEDPETHYNLAYAYHARKRVKEALQELETVFRLDPRHVPALALKKEMTP